MIDSGFMPAFYPQRFIRSYSVPGTVLIVPGTIRVRKCCSIRMLGEAFVFAPDRLVFAGRTVEGNSQRYG